jgi:hypothetical protein
MLFLSVFSIFYILNKNYHIFFNVITQKNKNQENLIQEIDEINKNENKFDIFSQVILNCLIYKISQLL